MYRILCVVKSDGNEYIFVLLKCIKIVIRYLKLEGRDFFIMSDDWFLLKSGNISCCIVQLHVRTVLQLR
jgi:hypothetical protein